MCVRERGMWASDSCVDRVQFHPAWFWECKNLGALCIRLSHVMRIVCKHSIPQVVRQSDLIKNLERAIPNLEDAVKKLNTKLEIRTEKLLARYQEKKYLAIPFKEWVKLVLRRKRDDHNTRRLQNLLVRQRQAWTFQQWYRQVHLQKFIDAKTSYDLKLAGVSREIVRKYEDR